MSDIISALAVLATHLEWQWSGLNARFAAITARMVNRMAPAR